VNATVRDGVAQTEVSHVFRNRSSAPQEGDFVFPIPAGATVSSFAMYDGETKLPAHLLEKEDATRTYEEIVRSRRDPALLTYQGRAALRARVFPIAPGNSRRLTLKLVTVLPREGDAKKYVWTLVGPHLPSNKRPESLSVRVMVDGKQPVGNVYSPTHEIRTRRDSDSRVVASWEMDKNDPLLENTEFSLYMSSGKGNSVALSALTHNASLPQVASLSGAMRQSGYFMVIASPAIPEKEIRANTLPRRVVMVMDRSGSMQGKKIEQAKGALKFALGKLRPQDSFNILTFSDRVENFAPEPIAATPENQKRAEAFVEDIVADGGTNINDALKTGLAMFPERGSGNTLLFFTDGEATVGVKQPEAIIRNAIAANERRVRCFVFGVGYDVDVPFLDEVSQKLRGDADYVRPDENIEVKASQFVAKTSAPVLANLKLTVEGAKVGEIFPKPDDLPDLFAGSQLVLVGRYTGDTAAKITITGEANGKPQTYTLNARFPALDTSSDFLPRLWAGRKIGYLMDEVRLNPEAEAKKERIEQIIALSREFGILTPYTAMFVPEPGTTDTEQLGRTRTLDTNQPSNLSAGVGMGGFGGSGGGAGQAPAGPVSAGRPALRSGEAAVNMSQLNRAQKGQGTVGNLDALRSQSGEDKKQALEVAKRIQNVAQRTFYQQGKQWTDATYDPKKQKEVVKIKLYSPAYFALTRRNADFAKWASLGNTVLITANGKQAVLFSDMGKENLSEAELKALAGK
jgi:Ca-activated chloride channel family protein